MCYASVRHSNIMIQFMSRGGGMGYLVVCNLGRAFGRKYA